ncbi:hypothetical protein M0804_015613 [Polistes exclamans]|nr:hypothetical protein M0804_015613 [Polistes exclamans]
MDSQSIYILLQNILAALAISCSFGAVNLKLSTIRDLVSYIEYDYENLLDENDLKTSEKYTKITRFYIIILTGSIILYGILMTTPTVLSIFLYMYTSLDSVNIQYIFPVNSNNSGFLRYGLLMLQIIALFTVLIIACVIYATYLEPYHCSFKIRHPFTKEECIVKNWDNQINKKESEWIINIIKKYTRVTKCQVPIYTLAKKNQKLLLLITMRSSRPSELSIGGLFSASHEIFAEVCNNKLLLINKFF